MASFLFSTFTDQRPAQWFADVQTRFQRLTDRDHDREWIHVTLDELGKLSEFGMAQSKPRDQSARVCLHLVPGVCLLRRLSVATLSAKQIGPALELWADESLPSSVDQYYLDSWAVTPQMHGLAALPRALLSQARQQIVDRGGHLTALHVPELRPPIDARSGIVVWVTPVGLLTCLWQQHVLYDWQSFQLELPARAIVEQVAASCRDIPDFVYLNGVSSAMAQMRVELETMWPQTEMTDTERLDDGQATDHRYGAGPAFTSYLNEEQQQAATHPEKLRLGLSLGGVLLACFFLFFANVTHLQQQVEQTQHHVSLLKMRANRSEKVAARIGDTMNKVRELRSMTTERHGVLVVLKELNETLPSRVKLDNFTVERDGATALDGVAETELDISAMLERFRRSSLFRTPNLTFIQKDNKRDGAQALIRFRLEARVAQPLLHLPGDGEGEANPG